jgi:hypothetical protein
MFLALKKIKIFQLANETKLVSEISKVNKEILLAYEIKKPVKPSYNFSGF